MVTIFYYKGALFIKMWLWELWGRCKKGGGECEGAARVGEKMTRKPGKGFPLIYYISILLYQYTQ